jgi:hypothetical protein
VLKKIGTVILDGSQVATEILGFPFISQLIGQIPFGRTTVGAVATTGLVSLVEVAYPSVDGSKTGPQKLAALTPMVQQAILLWAKSSLPGHNKIKDPALLQKGAGEISQGLADSMNAFGE